MLARPVGGVADQRKREIARTMIATGDFTREDERERTRRLEGPCGRTTGSVYVSADGRVRLNEVLRCTRCRDRQERIAGGEEECRLIS